MTKAIRIDIKVGMYSAIKTALEIAEAHEKAGHVGLAAKWANKANEAEKRLNDFY